MVDDKPLIPDAPGFYLICLKDGATAPPFCDEVVFTRHEEHRVLYLGIAGAKNSKRKSLLKRGYLDHFGRDNAGKSTLRKSIGVLFGYRLVPRDKDPSSGKTKFSEQHEKELSKWMRQSLLLFFIEHPAPWKVEAELIAKFNPPLNLDKNNNAINAAFRRKLSSLRNANNLT